MNRKLKLFIQKNLFQNWKYRFFHLVGVFSVFTLTFFAIFAELNTVFVKNFINQTSVYTFVNPIWITGFLIIYTLVFFNVNLLIRSLKWDIFFFIFSFIFLNGFGSVASFYYNQEWPFLQTNLFLILEVNISSFCRIAILDKENSLVQKVFSKYVNKDLLDEIVAKPKELNLEGKQKHMTVLFSDIRGFTTLSEQISAKKLVVLLNKYLNEMSNIVLRNNGTIDKFIGDAVMAFWNAPIEDKNHATNSVLTAISMIQRLNELKRINPEFKILNIGIGINTGDMIVGNIGSKDRFNYTIIGDNVNLGARLEGLTKKYGIEILVSQNTVSDFINLKGVKTIFRLVDEIRVKGKTLAIKVYQPLHETKHNYYLKSHYEAGFRFYQKGLFKEAYRIFTNLSKSGDPVSKTMVLRIDKLHPQVHWDGIWNWDEK